MAVAVWSDARAQFGAYALAYAGMSVRRIHEEDLQQLAQMAREIERYLSGTDPEQSATDPAMRDFLEQVVALHVLIAQLLARVGPDAAWNTDNDLDAAPIILTERETADLVDAIEHPRGPNEALQNAFQTYRTMIGL
jgi:hypothetical protein